MIAGNSHPEPRDAFPTELSAAARLRAMADGESIPSGVNAGASDIDHLDARVAFERELRSAVGRVMNEPASAPAELRAKIQALLASDISVSSTERSRLHEPVERRHAHSPAQRRHLVQRLSGFVITLAVLALAASVIFTAGQRGGLIGTGTHPVPGPIASNPTREQVIETTPVMAQASLLDDSVVRFVDEEHDSCDDFGSHFQKKFTSASADQVLVSSNELFQAVPHAVASRVRQLEQAGYCLEGLGVCGLPGKQGPVVHLIFRNPRVPGGVSIFFRKDDCASRAQTSHCCDRAEKVGNCKGNLLAWQDGPFDYYLYTSDLSGLAVARDAFGLPADLRRDHD